MLGAFVRAISRALSKIKSVLTDKRGDMENDEDEIYAWDRYRTGLCEEICKPREGVWLAIVKPDGQVKFKNGDGVPPGHVFCDCAMKNQRTGGFRWISPYALR